MKRVTPLLIALSILAGSTAAEARKRDLGAPPSMGSAELVLGVVQPLGDDDYDTVVDSGFKLGARGVVWLAGSDRMPFGFELGADWTSLSADSSLDLLHPSLNRFRLLAGVRGAFRLTDRVAVFARAGAGLDRVEVSGWTGLEQLHVDWSADDSGFGLEVGAGASVRLMGPLALGLQLVLPFGFHSDDEDGDGNVSYDNDYTSEDLDLLFSVGAEW